MIADLSLRSKDVGQSLHEKGNIESSPAMKTLSQMRLCRAKPSGYGYIVKSSLTYTCHLNVCERQQSVLLEHKAHRMKPSDQERTKANVIKQHSVA